MTFPRIAVLMVLTCFAIRPAIAEPAGMVHVTTSKNFAELVAATDLAAKTEKIGIVTRASATNGVKAVLGKDIPGNMVIGIFHPRFADRLLAASLPAGIEAPIRLYLTENTDGSATVSYRKPSAIFADYPDGGPDLMVLADELDALIARMIDQVR